MEAVAHPAPAGFGDCGGCAYRAVGPPSVCQKCAAATLKPAAPFPCPVCGQRLASATAACVNMLCSSTDRQFVSNTAIAMKTGEPDAAIKLYE
ncbi:hypothetical protein [Actinoalloteichus hoggarensis]|uniref:Uncharacterized protein n=1 Tax=Actinoalloteichus hoggarensis TaxID=1470176 RepID=A0A221VZ11_9PSEU|nr:hypothetical protein [Actinoalloteichus hoggarensis]ASO18769.1 hypothetical protein AHOG_05580 [Actinoalloteichus hoggarensis]